MHGSYVLAQLVKIDDVIRFATWRRLVSTTMAAADAAAADPAIAMSAAKVRGSKNTKKAWRKSDIAVRTQGGQRQRYEPELTTTRCQLDGAANAAGRTL